MKPGQGQGARFIALQQGTTTVPTLRRSLRMLVAIGPFFVMGGGGARKRLMNRTPHKAE
jgi:hypothetical protein